MPALTDEQREARRSQILDGARACVAEYGLEAVSMEMIVERSGLSVGAVYRYFKGKDEIIAAAVTDGNRGWISALQPLLTQPDPPPLPELVKQLLQTIDTYRSGFEPDRRDVAVHGWSHAQTSPPLRAEVAALYRGLRDQYTSVCKTWQASSQLDPSAHPAAVAQLMMSITLGHTAQQALLGDSSGPEQAAALAALATPGDRTSGVRKR